MFIGLKVTKGTWEEDVLDQDTKVIESGTKPEKPKSMK